MYDIVSYFISVDSAFEVPYFSTGLQVLGKSHFPWLKEFFLSLKADHIGETYKNITLVYPMFSNC